MKYSSKSTLKGALTAVSLAISGGMFAPAVQAFDYPAPGDFALGAKQYVDNCSRCHNIRSANELRDDQWITTMFHMRVRAGLTGEEMRNILTFLQTSNNVTATSRLVKTSAGTVVESSGLTGKEVYGQTCIACHGATGKGVLPGVPNLTHANGRLSKPDQELLNNIRNGFQSPGSPMAMPPKGGNASLTDEDLRNVIEYMHQEFGS